MVSASTLATPLASTLTPLVSILGGRVGATGRFGGPVFLAFSLLAFEFITLTLFDMAFVLIMTTFATEAAGDSAPEVILMVHCFSIFSMLLPLQLQQASTAMVAIRGMTRSPSIIDRSAVEEWGQT